MSSLFFGQQELVEVLYMCNHLQISTILMTMLPTDITYVDENMGLFLKQDFLIND